MCLLHLSRDTAVLRTRHALGMGVNLRPLTSKLYLAPRDHYMYMNLPKGK